MTFTKYRDTGRQTRIKVAGAFVAGLAAAFIHGTANGEILHYIGAHGPIIEVDTEDPNSPYRLTGGAPAKVVGNKAFQFNIFYADVDNNTGAGFDDPSEGQERRGAVDRVMAYLVTVLSESGAVDILFDESDNDAGSGVLAFAGTNFPDEPGVHNGDAFMRITTGVDPDPEFPEIMSTVNFGHPWFAGLGETPAAEFDLFTVLLHEITHGLGVIAALDENGTTPFGENWATKWGTLLGRGMGGTLYVVDNAGIPTFTGSAADMTSNDLVFIGQNAGIEFGSFPPIYSPDPFEQGSSISHWDQQIPGAIIMRPQVGTGPEFTFREFAPFEIAALGDLGYTIALNVTVNQGQGQQDPTGRSPIVFEIKFSDPVIGFGDDPKDVRFVGTANDVTYTLEPVGGSRSVYRVEATVNGEDGTVVPVVPANVAMNAEGALELQNLDSRCCDNVVTFDSIPPTVRVGPPSVPSTVNGPVTFEVFYEDALNSTIDLPASSVRLIQTGPAAGPATGTVDVETTAPAIRKVILSEITGEGTLAILILPDTARDPAGNGALLGGPSPVLDVLSHPPSLNTTIQVTGISPRFGLTQGDVQVTIFGNFPELATVADARREFKVTFGDDEHPAQFDPRFQEDSQLTRVAVPGELFVLAPEQDFHIATSVNVRVSRVGDPTDFIELANGFTYTLDPDDSFGDGEGEGEGEGEGGTGGEGEGEGVLEGDGEGAAEGEGSGESSEGDGEGGSGSGLEGIGEGEGGGDMEGEGDPGMSCRPLQGDSTNGDAKAGAPGGSLGDLLLAVGVALALTTMNPGQRRRFRRDGLDGTLARTG